jgi:predicted  nucleic acid-binding Zn-ribbon protein
MGEAVSFSFKERVMSAKVDRFCNDLRQHLQSAEDRLTTLKAGMRDLPQRGEGILHANLEQVRGRLETEKTRVEHARAQLASGTVAKIREAQERIDEWKAKRETKKLNRRADRAEEYAVAAVVLAAGSIDEAEAAILDAILARADEDAAQAATAAVH